MQNTIWLDGKLVPESEATLPFLTHALHYGSAVFEGIRFYQTEKGPAIFRLKEHVDRLFYSASALSMKMPYSEEEIFNAIVETVRATGLKEGYIRPLVFYGSGRMVLNPIGANINVAIAAWAMPPYLGLDPIKIKISQYIRIHPKSLNNHAKISGHYVNSINASIDAKHAGFDEALLLDYEGNLAEGPGANIFLIKHDLLVTPPGNNILPGITRDSLIQIAKKDGYHVREININPKDIQEYDEAFYAGTAAEVTPIASIDGKPFKSKQGEVTTYLKEKYSDIVHGKVKEYEHWLTYIN